MAREFEAVIFDMDGLMFDTEALGTKAWRTAAREFGYEITPEIFFQLIGRNKEVRRSVLTALWPEFPFDAAYARRIELGEADEREHGVPVKPGLHELLQLLREKGFRLALATGTDRPRTLRRLRQGGVAQEWLETILTPENGHKGKPDPAIFLAAAQSLGVEPARCLVFEDSNAGVEAAFRAGMPVLMVPDIVPPTEESRARAWQVLNSLHDALPLIDEGSIRCAAQKIAEKS